MQTIKSKSIRLLPILPGAEIVPFFLKDNLGKVYAKTTLTPENTISGYN
jgi:hypothetical protein